MNGCRMIFLCKSCFLFLIVFVHSLALSSEFPSLVSATFEKDDDSNGHIDFIVATSVCALFVRTFPLNVFDFIE